MREPHHCNACQMLQKTYLLGCLHCIEAKARLAAPMHDALSFIVCGSMIAHKALLVRPVWQSLRPYCAGLTCQLTNCLAIWITLNAKQQLPAGTAAGRTWSLAAKSPCFAQPRYLVPAGPCSCCVVAVCSKTRLSQMTAPPHPLWTHRRRSDGRWRCQRSV
jgi:hypothetical protein